MFGIFGALVVVLLILLVSSRATGRAAAPATTSPLGVQQALQTPLPPQTRDRALELIRLGQKIQAIKELRAGTGYGLLEAKEVVEALEAGRGPGSTADPVQDRPVADAVPDRSLPDRSLADRTRQLLDQGHEVQAIRLVCDETGMGIPEAQAFIRSLRS